MRHFIFGFLFAFITVIIFYLTQFIHFDSFTSCFFEALRIFLIFVGIFILILWLYVIFRSNCSRLIKNIFLSLTALTVLFLLLEAVFMFAAYPFGNNGALAARLWYFRHWKINSSGFRDENYYPDDTYAKKNILVIGDSFVAGDGIKNPADRFTDRLSKKVSGQYCLYNVGKNGADTQEELECLAKFPVKPDILILCHYINDIEYLAGKNAPDNMQATSVKTDTEIPESYNCWLKLFYITMGIDHFAKKTFRFFKPLVNNSCMLNFFYNEFQGGLSSFLFYSGHIPREVRLAMIFRTITHKKIDELKMYLDKDIFASHLSTLDKFITWTDTNKTKLVLVLFPRLNDVFMDFTNENVNIPIEKFFRSRNIPVLNTYAFLNKLPQNERTVNRMNVHPSVEANKIIADSLFNFLVREKIYVL